MFEGDLQTRFGITRIDLRWVAGDRRLGDAGGDFDQHERADDHDCGEGRGDGVGGGAWRGGCGGPVRALR
jgi:hypothetical protein